MKKFLIVFLVAIAFFRFVQSRAVLRSDDPAIGSSSSDQVLASAFEERRRNLQVEGHGVVIRILPDDVQGPRHQRFIIKLGSGQTLLVAHNIDVAPRISTLRNGDTIAFTGEYQWNEEGGVIDWTHHDPGGRHLAGWIKHNGITYQ